MVQGRGGAMTAAVLLCLLLSHLELAQAATYTVGGAGGWTFNTVGWTKGKRFKAGDTLVFNYNPSIHNVVAVNKFGYSSCTTPKGAKVFRSGKDRIKLAKGQNFFICNFVGHCQSGMKIAVTAA
ncbi:Basic blue protein [Hibiscus syriacus]|uniref:Basic blue protein n=1 Tax=Hibiscus syriacus TaxID=106335 RepID=A0A6A2WU90_HIBSY|nr:basic blue protein-like [Hibiscus syriacus]KAE8664658.1 Basic blue protein [Hibiscus syriacus]